MKTGGRDFVPGHGIGRPRLPEEIKELSRFTRAEILEALHKMLGFSIHELEKILLDKNLTVVDHWMARIALMGIKNGDPLRLEWLLIKVFGKQVMEQSIAAREVDDPLMLREIPADKIIELIKDIKK